MFDLKSFDFAGPARVGATLLAAWLTILAGPAAAAEIQSEPPPIIDVWQMEDGLPENIVNAIAQTPDGYLWCGTTRGLARFDGVRFKVFNAENAPALGNAHIYQLLVDHRGVLWITTSEGRLIRLQDGQFTAFTPPLRESAARAFIRLAEDEAGTLWLTAEDGALLHFTAGGFTLVSAKWDATGKPYYHVVEDFQGRLWSVSRTGLARIDTAKEVLIPALTGKPGQYTVLCASRTGGWWVQTAGSVRLWRDGQWLTEAGQALWGESRVDDSLEDRAGRLWVASLGRGLFCFATNAPVRQLTVDQGLGSDLVRAVFEDTEGNLWAGTRAGGLNRVRPALFQTYGRKDGLAADQITAVCEGAGGELWVGTDGAGLDRMQNGVVTHFRREQGLTGLYVRALALDRRGELWACSWPGGLCRFETNGFVPVKNYSGPGFALASLFEDAHTNLWLGQRTLNQLVCLTNGVPAAPIVLSNSAPSVDIIAMAEDDAGNLWIGTQASGLFRWRAGQCRRFTRQDGLPNNSIRSLLADRDGALWIGTMDGGLARLKNDRIASCTTKDGLVDNVINHIADDGLGNLWFSSFRGVFRASKSGLNDFADGRSRQIQCVAYGRSDGLPTIECAGGLQPAGCRTRDGRLWFATIKGLVSIDPAHVSSASVPPPVLIEELFVDDQLFASGTNLTGGQRLSIPPGRHRFDFRYTGLDLAAPERVRFWTKLEGLDAGWVEAGERRTANYTPLPPGDYEFRVIACNQAGLWNETGAAFAFRVLPHLWQTWWFTSGVAGLAAAGLSGLVFFTARRRYQRRVERLETQLSVEKERARIAQDIHDGVGANLTEIAWLAEVAGQDAVRPEEVRIQTRKISGTARETVQLFDEIVWAVLPQNDTLTSLVEYLGRRVDEWFENSPTRCWFSAPRELPDIMVPAEVRHGFYLACKEALHNVNKHARATEVRVQVAVAGRRLQVDIEDNGCGFEAATVAGGNGLRNLRQRFQKLGGQFELQSRPGHGTKIHMAIGLTSPAPP